MGTKNTSKQIVGSLVGAWEDIPWHIVLKQRAQDLASDKDHTLTYADRDRITINTSRKEIVHLYETAYSELAESFHGHLEYIAELEADKTNLNKQLNDQLTFNLELRERLGSASRQLTGLLELIEKPVKEPLERHFPSNPDQFQASQYAAKVMQPR